MAKGALKKQNQKPAAVKGKKTIAKTTSKAKSNS